MAFDARYLSCVLEELEKKCASARVEKIYQPSRDTLIFLLRCQQGREKLLIAANPTAPRLHLTAASPENPPEPPMFCMFLRKHLLGARLASVSQIPMERAAFFTFDCTDEMGYPIQKTLAVELMGRTCNVYLLGPDGIHNGHVSDRYIFYPSCLRTVRFYTHILHHQLLLQE